MKLLVALGLLVCAGAVRFSVQHGEYIQICCGEPCKYMTFRLNRTSSEIWLHNPAYVTASRTYYQSQLGRDDREAFYFTDGSDTIRTKFRIRYFPVPSVTVGRETIAPDGTLGLGQHSQLWTIWNNYTLTRKRLDLGEYDHYGQRDHNARPPVLDLHDGQYVKLKDGTLLGVDFNMATTETYIPYGMDIETVLNALTFTSNDCKGMYHKIGAGSDVKCENTVTLHPDQLQSMTLSNGVDYEAVDYTEGNNIVIGTRFIDDFFWFRSLDAHSVIIAEDAFFLDYVGVSIGCSIELAALLAFWVTIADSKEDRSDKYEFMFMTAVEILSYLIDIILMLVMFGMLDWSRYVTQYCQTSNVYAIVTITMILATSIGMFVYTFVTWKGYTLYQLKFKHHGLFRAVLFISSQILFIWLCLVEQHETTFDRLFMALMVTLLGTYQLIALGLFWVQRQYVFAFVTLVLVCMTMAFNIIYNLTPTFRYGNMRHNFAIASFLWIYFFQFVPAQHVLVLLKLGYGLKKAEARKVEYEKQQAKKKQKTEERLNNFEMQT